MTTRAVRGPFQGEDRFLSNFWVEKNGKTNEHFFQTPKTLDKEARKRIFNAPTAGESKKMASKRGFAQLSAELGRPITLREDWESVKIDVMTWSLRRKFEDPKLAAKLLATGDDELIEKNTWHDIEWGHCTCPKHKGEGRNLLGQLLMQVRAELLRGDEPPAPDERLRLSSLAT